MLLLQAGKTPCLHVYQLSYILITYSFDGDTLFHRSQHLTWGGERGHSLRRKRKCIFDIVFLIENILRVNKFCPAVSEFWKITKKNIS